MNQALHFQIDPQPGESTRACSAIARAVLPTARGNLLLFGLYVAVGIASYFLTPSTRLTTFVISLGAVMATVYGLQVVGRANLRHLQQTDSHASETHSLEVSATGVHTWCSHVDARYPWTDFRKVTENSEFYLLVRPNGTGAAVPKRLLDEATDAQLREQLRSGPQIKVPTSREWSLSIYSQPSNGR